MGSCEDAGTHDALMHPACLSEVLARVGDLPTLGRCTAVCQQWRTVLLTDEIWRTVYLARHTPPLPSEWAGSYRRQVDRLQALARPIHLQPYSSCRGAVATYCTSAQQLVVYEPQQRQLHCVQQQPVASGGCGLPPAVASLRLELAGGHSAQQPQLAAAGDGLVLVSAFDGVLQVVDVSQGAPQLVGQLGEHPTFLHDLTAGATLAASVCSQQLALWHLPTRTKAWAADISTLTSPGCVALCEERQLLAAYHALPGQITSSLRVYSTREGAQRGALVKELPVTAVTHLVIQGPLLLAASSYSSRPAAAAERSASVVVTVWHLDTWLCTRLVSPRIPGVGPTCRPLLHVTQGQLLVAAPEPGTQCRSSALYAWPLPALPEQAPGGLWWGEGPAPTAQSSSSSSSQGAHGMAGTSGGGCGSPVTAAARVRVTPRAERLGAGEQQPALGSTRPPGGAALGAPNAAAAAAAAEPGTPPAAPAAAGAREAGGLAAATAAQLVLADGRFQDADALVRPADAAQSSVVMLVGGSAREAWQVVAGSIPGRVSSLLAMPAQLVATTDADSVWQGALLT